MGERPTILLADDEEAITAELQPFLERAGFDVLVARDGEAALAASLDRDPDLIALDVLMPRLDGREVLRRLRAGGRFNPVVLLTQVGTAGVTVDASLLRGKLLPEITSKCVRVFQGARSTAYNDRLSVRRAEAVKQWLAGHGIAASRISTHGYGESEPVDSNATTDGRQHNRRVVIGVAKG